MYCVIKDYAKRNLTYNIRKDIDVDIVCAYFFLKLLVFKKNKVGLRYLM